MFKLEKGLVISMNLQNASFLASYGLHSQIPPCEKPEIAFAGRSNVGKSTLLNKLMQRKALARVSAVPGKTATINFYDVEQCHLVDLPGYGYAKISKSDKARWAGLIEGYLQAEDRDLRLVFLLVDMRHAPSADDLHMINYLIDAEQPFIVVLTKADKLGKTARAQRMEAFEKEIPCFSDMTVIPFSSMTLEGVDTLREIIDETTAPDAESDEHEEEFS